MGLTWLPCDCGKLFTFPSFTISGLIILSSVADFFRLVLGMLFATDRISLNLERNNNILTGKSNLASCLFIHFCALLLEQSIILIARLCPAVEPDQKGEKSPTAAAATAT